MAVRIEYTRRIDAKQGKGRNRINPVTIAFEPTEAEAIEWMQAVNKGSEEMAPGYMPILKIALYDNDTFRADPFKAVPFRTIEGDELAQLFKEA